MNIGIVYAVFGPSSAIAAKESLVSIRKQGITIPAVSTGTREVRGATFIPWEGLDPWVGTQTRQGYLAGRVKPFLYNYSPFEFTLYLDADTEICGNIMPGFELLREYDVCIADDGRFIENIYKYNKLGAEWNWARDERDFTSALLGKPKNREINSGVIFFRKSSQAEKFFVKWYEEWTRFQQWDEQFAFLRAEHDCPETKIKHLPQTWNEHDPTKPKIIWHKWGYARDRHILPKEGSAQ